MTRPRESEYAMPLSRRTLGDVALAAVVLAAAVVEPAELCYVILRSHYRE